MLIDIRSKDRDIISFKDQGKKVPAPVIGLTSGCFDLFHSLHLSYLQKCRRMCDFLVVGVDCDDFVAKSPSSPTAQPHPFSQAKPVMENNMAEGKFLEEQSLPAPCSNLIDRLRKYFGLMRQNWARESIIRRATCQSQGNRNLNFRSMPAIMLHWSLATCVRSGQRKVLHRCFKRRQGRLLRLSWNIWCENSISCSFEGWKTDKSEMMKRKLKLRVLAAFTIIQDGEFLSNLAVYKSTNCDSGRRYSCLQFGFIKQKDSFDVKFFNTI